MASPFPQITTPPQALAEVLVNNAFETLQTASVYGKAHLTTSGLTWGYYGGRWGGFAITAGTLTLSASGTNYVVVAKASGVISVSTSATNWNDGTNYARVYKLTTSATVVTAEEDHRSGPGGVQGGGSATGAGTTQANEMISGYLGAPTNKTYKLVVKAAHGGTITEATTISESGTCTATFKLNTTALGGTANSVSTTEQSQAHSSANVFAAGDDIQVTVSSSSSPVGLSFTIKYTRTLS